MAKYQINQKDIIQPVRYRLKYEDKDFLLAISSSCRRRMGKSTLGWQLLKKVCPKFKPEKNIGFSRESIIQLIRNLEKGGGLMADEAVNAVFNRDFYMQKQKLLLKILDMYGDKNLFVIMIIPDFWSFDKHIRALFDMRIDITKRGLAAVYLPVIHPYISDPWLKYENEKIAKKTSRREIDFRKSPNFVGYFYFSDLKTKDKEAYLKIKGEKRGKLNEGEEGEDEKEKKIRENRNAIGFLAKLKINDKLDADLIKMWAGELGMTRGNLRNRIYGEIEKQNAALPRGDVVPKSGNEQETEQDVVPNVVPNKENEENVVPKSEPLNINKSNRKRKKYGYDL